MIWLFPDGQTNSFYGDAFDGHKQVYSHIIHEALPYVDANYRTIDDRNHRAMEGFSMGGFGAAMYTAKHPELFSAVVEYGGALSTWQNLSQFNNAVAVEMYNAVEANFLPYSLWDLTTANAGALRLDVNYKMIVGDADSQYQSNLRFRDHLQSLGIDPQFQVLPGVEHVGGAYLSDGSGLRFLSEHFASVFRREGDYDLDGDVDTDDYGAWEATFESMAKFAADGNEDGVVNAADDVVWRKTLGNFVVPPFIGADGDGDSSIDPGDFDVWQEHFGETLAAAGSGVVVSELHALQIQTVEHAETALAESISAATSANEPTARTLHFAILETSFRRPDLAARLIRQPNKQYPFAESRAEALRLLALDRINSNLHQDFVLRDDEADDKHRDEYVIEGRIDEPIAVALAEWSMNLRHIWPAMDMTSTH